MHIAITGASGFVGAHLTQALVHAGHTVSAFGRRPSHPVPVGATYLTWDLTKGPLTLTDTPDAVVHCAGAVTDWGPDALFFQTHVTGTRAALETFRITPRFVYLSTASVYNPWQPKIDVREDAPYASHYLNAYAATKVRAEQLVLASGRDAIILRPHAVYGPGDRTLLPRLLAARRFGYLPAVGDGRNNLSVTHIDNLVQALLAAVMGPVTSGVFNVADQQVATLDNLLRTLLQRLGLPDRIAYLPTSLAWQLGGLLEHVYRVMRHTAAPPLTRYVVSQLAYEYTLSIQRARDQLGYAPTVTYRTGRLLAPK